MQIKISTRHGHLSAGTQEKVSSKLSKLSRFSDRLTSLDATVDLEHPDAPRVELRASVAHAEPFVATDTSESLLGSVDAVIRKLEQQLRRHKEKITDRRHTGAKAQRTTAEPGLGPEPELEPELEPEAGDAPSDA